MIDELPYLMDSSGAFESVLQRAWDRELSRKPALLILIGSDLSMMETLTSYGRPFHQRGAQMTVGPLNPADLSAMAGLTAAEAFDATLITGGLPIVCAGGDTGKTEIVPRQGAGQPRKPAGGLGPTVALSGIP